MLGQSGVGSADSSLIDGRRELGQGHIRHRMAPILARLRVWRAAGASRKRINRANCVPRIGPPKLLLAPSASQAHTRGVQTPALRWLEPPEGPAIALLDQTRLPAVEAVVTCADVPGR